MFCAATFQKILALIANPVLANADVRLSTTVKGVKTNEEVPGKVKITLAADRRELYFDEVVVTSPLGWLKFNKEVFEPPLPPSFAQAIDATGYGNLEKVESLSFKLEAMLTCYRYILLFLVLSG